MITAGFLCMFVGVWLGWIFHDWADGEPAGCKHCKDDT